MPRALKNQGEDYLPRLIVVVFRERPKEEVSLIKSYVGANYNTEINFIVMWVRMVSLFILGRCRVEPNLTIPLCT